MSTNSMISAKIDDRVKTIYCHWDGYTSHNGQILLDHYNNQEKVEALLKLGWLSVLDKDCTCPAGHTFDTPVKGHCVSYPRDNGEKFDGIWGV